MCNANDGGARLTEFDPTEEDRSTGEWYRNGRTIVVPLTALADDSFAFELNGVLTPEVTTGRRAAPGGGFFRRSASGLQQEAPGVGASVASRCVPTTPILSGPAAARAVSYNRTRSVALRWGNLVDQIEVNIFGCPRTNARLSVTAFAQAVAQFQRNQGLVVDGMLGPITWARMKAIRVERDPFPRADPPAQDFDDTPDPTLCEARTHPAIDIPQTAGRPIPAVADGLVVYAGPVGRIVGCATAGACVNGTAAAGACNQVSYGRVVIIEHSDRGPGMQPGGDSVYTIYSHVQFASGRRVRTGQHVLAGQFIAEVGAGCVGFSTGPHLHYVVATGRRGLRLAAGPSFAQICARLWANLVPRRPRTTTSAAFVW
jgi:hypothetical protein